MDTVIDPARAALLWVLLAFVVTAAVTRGITRRIRAAQDRPAAAASEQSGEGVIKDVHIGGIHVHHQVWGILTVLVTGLLVIAGRPDGWQLNLAAAAFGAGAALTLDEFAMWLHVEDVYWRREGRKSISAMMTAVAICFVLLLGADPLDLSTEGGTIAKWVVAVAVVVDLTLAVVGILKGKLVLSLFGVFFPVVLIVGATRLAKPGSWWARRRYTPGGRKDLRSRARFGPAYVRRWERIQDLIGGRPTP